MISPYNPKILLYNFEGRPAPKAMVFFFEVDTDVPKSVKYVEGGTLTSYITADSSGEFPQVELLAGDYTLKGYIPIDPKEPYPEFPVDYELRSTWNLSGPEESSSEPDARPEYLADLAALRTYDGDAEKVWVDNRLFIRGPLNTLTDNNGTVIVSSSLDNVAWFMDLTGYAYTDVSWFGADRTGAADSTASIKAAESAIFNSQSLTAEYKLPSTLYIPSGLYKINSTIAFSAGPVFMEKNVKFANTSNYDVVLNFYYGLETDKNDEFAVSEGGLKDVCPRFPAPLINEKTQVVNLAWYHNNSVDMEWFIPEVSIVGSGEIVAEGIVDRKISTLDVRGSITIWTRDSASLRINEVVGYDHYLIVYGSNRTEFTRLNLSKLESPQYLNKCKGNELIIDENWSIDQDMDLQFAMIHGDGSVPVVSNSSATNHLIYNSGTINFSSLNFYLHNITPKFPSTADNWNWSNANGADFKNYLLHGSSDMKYIATSFNATLDLPTKLDHLNNHGSITCIHSLELNESTVFLTGSQKVTSPYLKITNSTITSDSSNAYIHGPDIRIFNSYIDSYVVMDTSDDMQLFMNGCRFTQQVNISTAYTVKSIVITNNEVARCEILHTSAAGVAYQPEVKGWSDGSIFVDISNNWTTDTSGILMTSKGWINFDDTNRWYNFTTYGIVDFRKTSDGTTWAYNSRISPSSNVFWGRGTMETNKVWYEPNGSAGSIRVGSGSWFDDHWSSIIFVDPWQPKNSNMEN